MVTFTRHYCVRITLSLSERGELGSLFMTIFSLLEVFVSQVCRPRGHCPAYRWRRQNWHTSTIRVIMWDIVPTETHSYQINISKITGFTLYRSEANPISNMAIHFLHTYCCETLNLLSSTLCELFLPLYKYDIAGSTSSHDII